MINPLLTNELIAEEVLPLIDAPRVVLKLIDPTLRSLPHKFQTPLLAVWLRLGLTYIQVGRYEKQKSKPSSAVLQKLAEALNTSADYLMNGTSEQIAAGKITDRDLLELFQAVEVLNEKDKDMVKTFLDALITKRKVQSLAS